MTSIRLQGKHKPIYHALSEFELLHNIPHVVNDIYIIVHFCVRETCLLLWKRSSSTFYFIYICVLESMFECLCR